jgi:tetratricopeptide (TPR) repeat protein
MFGITKRSVDNPPTQIDLRALFQEIQEIDEKVRLVLNKAEWPHVQQAQGASTFAKISAVKIGVNYYQMASYYFKLEGAENAKIAHLHWKNAVKYMKSYCDYRSMDQNIDYENWLNLSSLYYNRIKFCFSRHAEVPKILHLKKVRLMKKGLLAANQAFALKNCHDAIRKKHMFLQMLKDEGETPPESPLVWMKSLLDTHPDPNSDDFWHAAQLYGEELAGEGKLEEAHTWLNDLLQKKKDPITYLYLGKIEDEKNHAGKAIDYFKQASRLAPDSIEIKLWLISGQVKDGIAKFDQCSNIPSQDEIVAFVGICNAFCSFYAQNLHAFKGETSTNISLEHLAGHFYATLLPKMAHVLARLQQFPFALNLYKSVLENKPYYLKNNFFGPTDIAGVYISMGGIHLVLDELKEAECCLLEAIQIDPDYLMSYQNLLCVYGAQNNEAKIDKLWEAMNDHFKDFSKLGQNEAISDILFNFGSAYCGLIKGIQDPVYLKAETFYEHSLKFNPENWDAKLHLARLLLIRGEQATWIRARDLLTGFEEYEKTVIFGVSPQRKFQIYFCLSGAFALCKDIENAKRAAIEAQKTRFSDEQVQVLRDYLRKACIKEKFNTEICEPIQNSIQKLDFDFRVGKLLSNKKIVINEGEFIGYHGTVDLHLDAFKEGITPQSAEERQFNGKGFYIASDREIATYFAMKKAKEKQGGNPILLKIYVDSGKQMVGQLDGKTHKKLPLQNEYQYDFIEAKIDGFERFSQRYIFENSLSKLKPVCQYETVNWTQEEYKSFLGQWTKRNCT